MVWSKAEYCCSSAESSGPAEADIVAGNLREVRSWVFSASERRPKLEKAVDRIEAIRMSNRADCSRAWAVITRVRVV